MARRIGIVVLIIVAVLGALVGGALFWATSESGARYISTKLQGEILRETGLEISFGDIDIDVFPPRIRIVDIKAGDEKARVICTAEEAEFSPKPLELFTGEIKIEEVYLGTPDCRVKLNTQDISELKGKFAKDDGKSEGFNLAALPDFGAVAMSEGSFVLDIDDEEGIGTGHFELNGLGLDITGGSPNIEIRALIEGASADWSNDGKKISEKLTKLQLRAALSEDAVDLRKLEVSVGGALIDLRDAHVPIPLWPQGPDVTSASIFLPLDLANRLPLGLPHLEGTVKFDGQISTHKGSEGQIKFQSSGGIDLQNAAIDDFVIGNLTGKFHMTPKGVALEKLSLETADGTLGIDGFIKLEKPYDSQFDLQLDGIELARLLEQLTVSDSHVTQKQSGKVSVKGTLVPFKMSGTADLQVKDHTVLLNSFRSKKPDVALFAPNISVKGRIEATKDHLLCRGMKVDFKQNHLDVDVNFNFTNASWWLDAKSSHFKLDDLKHIAGLKMKGHGPINCYISGPLNKPNIKGNVTMENYVFEGMPLGTVETEIQFLNGVLSMNNINGQGGNSTYHAKQLVLDFNARGGMNITTKIEALNVALEDLANTFHIDTSGFGNPTGFVKGLVAVNYSLRRDDLAIEADLTHHDLEIFGEKFGTGPLRTSWSNSELTVTELSAAKGKDGQISITGSLLSDNSLNFIGQATDIPADSIDNPDFANLKIATTGRAFVVVEGTLDHPLGWAEMDIDETRWENERYEASSLELKLDGNIITGRGDIAGKLADLEYLNFDLDTNKFLIEGFVHNLDMAKFVDVGMENHRVSFVTTGDLAIKGYIDNQPKLAGYANLEQVSVRFDDLIFRNERPLKIHAKNSRFKIKRTRFRGPDVVFDVNGSMGLETMNIKVKGLAALNWAASLISGVDKTGGNVEFDVTANGNIGSPSLRGQARIKDGTVAISGFPYALEQIEGLVKMSPKLIQLLNLSGKTADGSFDVKGLLRLDNWEIGDYQFKVGANNLDLALMDDLTFVASTIKNGVTIRSAKNPNEPYCDADYKGKKTNQKRDDCLPSITGDVEIEDLRYTANIRMLELSDLSMDKLRGERTTIKKTRLFDEKNDAFTYDIRIHGDSNLQARNNLFDVNLNIDDVENPLRLVGTNQTFGFLGRVLGKQGQVRFAGKRFDVKWGALEFKDALRPDNPYFRVVADGQVRDWKVTIMAEGTVDEYELRFSSQPYLSQEDIFFLIMTGLTQTESKQFGSSAMSISAPILGQFGMGGSSDIPFEIQLYNEYSEKAGTDTTRIALGRWLTEDVWVELSSSLGDDQDVEANLDYKINDRFSIAVSYDNKQESSAGNLGLDLKFRLEF